MSLLFIDGFEGRDPQAKYNYAYGANGGFGGGASSTWIGGRFSGTAYGGFNYAGQGVPYMLKTFAASNQITVGVAVLIPNPLDTTVNLLILEGDSAGTQQLVITLVGGRIELRRNGSAIASSSAGTVPANIWCYMEVQATIHPTTGQATVMFNGATIISFTGNTKSGGTNNSIDAVRLYFDAAAVMYVDDFYILNESGTTNTTFLGDVRVQSIVPTGAGASAQFTPTGSASNWANVDELPASTSDYNASSVSGQLDTYAMQDVSATTSNVFGLQSNFTVAKSDAGSASLKPVVRIAGNNYYGSTFSPLSSPSVASVLFDVNPASSTAWSTTSINAVETGVEIA